MNDLGVSKWSALAVRTQQSAQKRKFSQLPIKNKVSTGSPEAPNFTMYTCDNKHNVLQHNTEFNKIAAKSTCL